MRVEEKLSELGLELPKAPKPVGAYVGAKEVQGLVFTAGQAPPPGKDFKLGKIGKDLTVEEGYEAAKMCALNCLAQLKEVIGDLDRIEKVVKVTGYINSADGFWGQPAVLDGFTELLIKLFGDEAGRPARSAIPVSLEGWIPLEVEMVVKLRDR